MLMEPETSQVKLSTRSSPAINSSYLFRLLCSYFLAHSKPIRSFTCSFKYLSSVCYVLDTVLGAEETAVYRLYLCPHGD